MSEELSPRARAILDAAERAVVAGTPAVASGAPTPPVGPSGAAATAEAHPLPRLAQATAPHRDWSDPAPGSPPVTAPGQLLAIVDQVVQAAEGARRRIDLLSATLDELIHRVDAAARPETRVLLDEVFGEGSAPGARLPWDGTNGR